MHPKFLTTTFTALMARLPSIATLALNSPLKFLRFVSLTTNFFLQQAAILIRRPGNWATIEYKFDTAQTAQIKILYFKILFPLL